MTLRTCTRCQKPYGEAVEGVSNVARSYAPFCSKRCADVDLIHWLKGDYVIGDDGDLHLVEDEPEASALARQDNDKEG